ncbi:MAG: aminotransferase class V-fold PLP-dependent enzyme, partial [Gammaproteobacteria bacterium]
FEKTGVHAMTLSSHKFYGPMGAGALIVDKCVPMHSLLQGGSQEKGLRAGTENVPAIVGFGMAAELAAQELVERADHVSVLRDVLEKELMKFSVVKVFSHEARRLPNTLQFGVQGFDGETLLMELDRRGFAVSSGSACTSGKTEPSHVLKAMVVANDLATSAIRVSLGRANTMAEVERFIEAIQQILGIKNSAVMMAANL